MVPLFGHDATVAAFVGQFIPGGDRGFGQCKAIGFLDNGDLVAGVVFHNWNPESGIIEMSGGSHSPRWLSKSALKTLFGYAFETAGCQLVVMRVSERNTRMRAIAERFGFTGHIIPRLRGRDEAEIIFTMTAEQWLSSRYAR